jgi:preprotein translocase subunit SecG
MIKIHISLPTFGLQNIILLSVNVLFSFYLLYLFNENGLSEPLQKVSVGYAIVFFIQGLLMLLFSFKNAKLPPQKINS